MGSDLSLPAKDLLRRMVARRVLYLSVRICSLYAYILWVWYRLDRWRRVLDRWRRVTPQATGHLGMTIHIWSHSVTYGHSTLPQDARRARQGTGRAPYAVQRVCGPGRDQGWARSTLRAQANPLIPLRSYAREL